MIGIHARLDFWFRNKPHDENSARSLIVGNRTWQTIVVRPCLPTQYAAESHTTGSDGLQGSVDNE